MKEKAKTNVNIGVAFFSPQEMAFSHKWAEI